MRAGLAAAAPGPLVVRALEQAPPPEHRVHVIAAGKASSAMAVAAHRVLGDRIHSGVVIGLGPADVRDPFRVIHAEHPQPGEGSLAAGRAALDIGRSASPEDLLLVLLSGGASSLMAAPADGLSADDKRQATAVLLCSGADIHALNTVRKHVSAVKGGRLAAASPARCLALVLSDVVGDDLSVIASGPTVPDASTYADAVGVIDRCGGRASYPAAVVAHLERGVRGELSDTPKPGDPLLARSTAQVIGSRATAIRGGVAEASNRGFQVVQLEGPIVGEARFSALEYFHRAAAAAVAVPGPCCIVSGGETTVTVSGAGRGGRNQEFALALVERLAALQRPAVLASVGTDGIDGPTDAAGAVIDGSTLTRGRVRGVEPSAFLSTNNSYAYFAMLGDLIKTGPTGTNVGDLQVFLLG
ncbi:MAG: DUF4147 domain-containing protein [Vicinamibacterales bacterium]